MNIIVETSAAASIAVALVNLAKFAWPTMPRWALAMISLVVGIGGTFVVSMAGGEAITSQLAAQNVLQGVTVALFAAGLDRMGVAAEQTRTVAQMEQARERFEASGVQDAPVERERLVQ